VPILLNDFNTAMEKIKPLEQASASRNEKREQNVTARAVIIGLLLVPINVYWVIVAELRWYLILTLNPLFVTPVFYLFALLVGNELVKRIAPRLVLKPAELIVIYLMLVLSCCVATHDYIINLLSTMGWARWFATPENQWETTLLPHLPKWLLVTDKEALKGYFAGDTSLIDPRVLTAWLAPLAYWSVFIFACAWMFLCLNVILRKAWTDHVKLSFPIVRLPLAMTEPVSPSSMMRSRILWMGFALAAGLDLMNGLHEWFPDLPYITLRAQPVQFATPPWTAVAPLFTTLYPFAIGLAFLVPLDVSFSCWFFYLFVKAQAIIGYMLGYGNVPGMPFPGEQGIGAWYVFGGFLIYSSRRHLIHAVRTALGPRDNSDASEPMSYRTAFWGLVAGMVVFCVFWHQAGMGPVWVIVGLGTYLLLSMCITRARAETGGQHNVWDLEPKNLMSLFDSHLIGPTNMAAAALSHWYWRLNRSHMMPSQLEAFKMAREHHIRLRSLVLPMVVATVIATAAGMWCCLHVFYSEGAAKCQGYAWWTGIESYNWLDSSLKSGFKTDFTRWGVVGSAALFTVMLAYMRTRFAWWPFHPLGYCIGPGLLWLWLPFLISWLAKLIILRYGGLRLYHRALPFFLGLVLGDYVMGALWSLIGILSGYPVLHIFH
jgi:hypothetical protein